MKRCLGSKGELKRILNEIVAKGAIFWRERDGKEQYAVIPLVLWGMYEHQLKRLTPGISNGFRSVYTGRIRL